MREARSRSQIVPRRARTVCALVALSTGTAAGQTISWASGVSGLWSVAGNWSPQNVPDTAGESAAISVAGTYTVTLDLSPGVGGLFVLNPGATLNVNPGRALQIVGPQTTNNGRIAINPSGAATPTSLEFAANATLDGSGRVVLGGLGDRSALATAPDVTLTQAAGHTVSGYGNVNAALINNGTVVADVSGQSLALVLNAKVNNSLMRAQGGGTLRIEGITVAQAAAGMLQADGGVVRLVNGTVAGGTLASAGTGTLEAGPGTSTLAGVAVQGVLNLPAASGLNVTGGLTNDGVITVNPTGGASPTGLTFADNGTLGGTGRLVLNGVGDRAFLATGIDVTLTQGAGHSVSGYGNLRAAMVNQGAITADVSGQILALATNAKTNAGLIGAQGGGTLRIDGVALTQTGSGSLRAEGGVVSLVNCSIDGGSLETDQAGLFEITSGTSTLRDVLNKGTLNLVVGTALGVTGGLVNDGVITVNPTAAANSTGVTFSTNAALGGSGRIVLRGGADRAYVATAPNVTVTQGADHGISGYGNIHAALLNEGTVEADAGGQNLTLLSNDKVNDGLMRAVASGVLRLEGMTLTQGPAGVLLADGGRIDLVNCAVAGGTIGSAGAGLAQVLSGVATLSGVANQGTLNIPATTALNIAGSGLTNNGTITVNPSGSAATTGITMTAPGTLDGSGRVVLNATGDRAYLAAAVNVVLTQGHGHTITGVGRLVGAFVNQGRVAPGLPVARMDLQGTYAQGAEGELALELGGTAPGSGYDQLSVSGAATLDGRLRVELRPGFTPGPLDSFTLLSAGSVAGTFSELDLPPLPTGGRLVYTPAAVVLMMCYSNCDGSTTAPALNVNDFVCFLNRFAAADPYANCDASTVPPVLNVIDFMCFLNRFAAGCP